MIKCDDLGIFLQKKVETVFSHTILHTTLVIFKVMVRIRVKIKAVLQGGHGER